MYVDENVDKVMESDNPFYVDDSVVDVTGEEYAAIFDSATKEGEKRKILLRLVSNTILGDLFSQERANNIFRYLLNKDGSYDDAEVEFITYYTVYLNYREMACNKNGKIKNKIYAKAVLPEIIFATPEQSYVVEDSFAAYDGRINTIFINVPVSVVPFKDGDKDKLFNYLQYISHEMVHFRHVFETKSGILSPASFYSFISNTIKYQHFDDQDNNYRFRKEEVSAQIESMNFVFKLGREFFPEYVKYQEYMLNVREKYMLEEVFSMQQDNTGAAVLRDFYDIGGLCVAVGDRPDFFLKGFPQLLAFFDYSGHLKSEEKLLKMYRFLRITNAPLKEIYEEFLIYIYNRGENLTNVDLPLEFLSLKKEFIFEQIEVELIKLDQIKRFVDMNIIRIGTSDEVWGENNTRDIVQQRKKRIKAYYSFLSNIKIEGEDDRILLDDLENMMSDYNDIIGTDIEKKGLGT